MIRKRPIITGSAPFAWIFVSCLSMPLVGGCGESLPRFGSYTFGEDVMQSTPKSPVEPPTPTAASPPDSEDAGAPFDPIEREEAQMEDPDALASLISSKMAPPHQAEPDAGSSAPPSGGTALNPTGDWVATTAQETESLTKYQCLAELEKRGVPFKEPGFETPSVDAPVLLSGPINGVSIEPRWPRQPPINAVMDCRLVLALTELARAASQLEIDKVLFYSTYRPLPPPPEKCRQGKRGAACREKRRKYDATKDQKSKSQHRQALAIDIGWLQTASGQRLDVLKDYDRRDGTDPCGYDASTPEGRTLQQFACLLHRQKVFHVMLTPNANRAHHNHFHFDITPNARWNIIR